MAAQLCDICQKGIHHDLQDVENCACSYSNAVRDEYTIVWKKCIKKTKLSQYNWPND
jgi:hypothetical protein